MPGRVAAAVAMAGLGVGGGHFRLYFMRGFARVPAWLLGGCQAAHGGLKTPSWAMMVAMSSAAHSSLILPSVTR
jgi:hypothetical protein